MDKNLLIIGAGNMGSAFYKGIAEVLPKEHLTITDTDENKLKALEVPTSWTDSTPLIEAADFILMAIKPQVFDDFCDSLKTSLERKFVISIMAGVSLKRIFEKTKCNQIIRAMPNLGVAVKKGVIGWIASGEVSRDEKLFTQNLFQSVGQEFEVLEEDKINSITPLSGSGPAFFFYLTELLEMQALKWGFTAEQASIIAKQTLSGSADFLEQGSYTAAQAREAVTSKGGVTEAAFKDLDESGAEEIIAKALEVAKKRCQELS